MCIKRLISCVIIILLLHLNLTNCLAENSIFTIKAITTSVFGGVDEHKTIWLEKGQVTPFSGYLITEDKVLNSIEAGLKLQIYEKELDKAYKRIENLESKSEWEKWLYIGIGAGLVLIAGWSLGQVK